jgi:peptide/nickel transport system substrate-binding protein
MASGQNVTMSAFDQYWGGRPYLDQFILKAITDPTTLISSLLSGETDATNFAPITAVSVFKANPNLKVVLGAPWIVLFLALNAKIGVTRNKLVRQAINYAIDRKAIRDGVFGGTSILPAGMDTPASWAYDPALQPRSTQNIPTARQLLARAGHPRGVSIAMDVENTVFYPRLAESMQSSAAAAGVKININKLDEGTFWGKVDAGKSQASVTQRSGFVADPDNKLTPLLYSTSSVAQTETGNDIYPNAKQLDHMLDQARAEPDRARRRQMYFQIQDWLLDMVPYVYLAYIRLPVVMQRYVMGVNANALGTYRLYPHDIWLNK